MNPLIRTPALCAMLCATLAGCYVLPYAPDGQPPTPYPYTYPYSGAPWPAPVAAAPAPLVLAARLYPANELAAQTGALSGTVTNLMTGKGRLQLQYKGEILQGEATRVDGDHKRGVASAYGGAGTFMNCDYQMQSPRQGAGMCNLSNGAKYQVHIGQ